MLQYQPQAERSLPEAAGKNLIENGNRLHCLHRSLSRLCREELGKEKKVSDTQGNLSVEEVKRTNTRRQKKTSSYFSSLVIT